MVSFLWWCTILVLLQAVTVTNFTLSATRRESTQDSHHFCVREARTELTTFSPQFILAKDLGKYFEQGRLFHPPYRTVALENVTLTLEGPGPFALVGDSGSGKSTFLRILCGEIKPSKGRLLVQSMLDDGAARQGTESSICTPHVGVYLDRDSLRTIDPTETVSASVGAALSKRSRSYPILVPGMPGVLHGKRSPASDLTGLVDEETDMEVRCLLCAVGLLELREQNSGELSRSNLLRLLLCLGFAKGKQSLQLSKVVATPGTLAGFVLCLDELLEFEEAPVREDVECILQELCRTKGVIVLSATHNMNHVKGLLAGGWGGRVVTFSKGQALAVTPVEESVYVIENV
ncbi:unnamed protein product [Choristocarpus tenellus]